ncbi:hypothetical protein IJ596_07230 [bacterium]|nr:hypothetical protein [bacterium]
MGKSKTRILRKGIQNQLQKLSREDAIRGVVSYLNSNDNNSAKDLISMFGLQADEILEAGASYESVVAIKRIFM